VCIINNLFICLDVMVKIREVPIESILSGRLVLN
jgi:hypothetical protein